MNNSNLLAHNSAAPIQANERTPSFKAADPIAPEKLLIPGTPMVLDLPGVATTLCVSISTVQQMVRDGKFPEPRQLSYKRVGWLTIEVATWAASRPKSTQLPPHNTGALKQRAKRAHS